MKAHHMSVKRGKAENSGSMQKPPGRRGKLERPVVDEQITAFLNRATIRRSPEGLASSLSGRVLTGPSNPARTRGLIYHLQQTAGNQYVYRMIQAKLKVGQPGDIYEKEADRVAERVMTMAEPQVQRQPEDEEEKKEEEQVQAKPIAEQITPLIQRQGVCTVCDEEEKEGQVQAKPIAEQITPLVQRQYKPEEEEKEEEVQAKPIVKQITPLVQRQYKPEEEEKKEEPVMAKRGSGRNTQISDGLQSRLSLSKGSGYPLPQKTRLFAENRFGADFSQVKVHTDTNAVQMARALNAEAFTSGRDVYFGEGRYNPDSREGKKLIAHELTHVIQQGGGSIQTKDAGYENRISHKESSNTKEKTVLPVAQSKSLASVPQIQTYGEDVHRDMTRDQATGVGFSSIDASVIADADQSVDTGATHPWRRTPREFVTRGIPGSEFLHFPSRSVAVGEVHAGIRSRNLRSFGRALHRYQDTYSHNFTTWSVPAWRILSSYCWSVNRPLAAAILLRNPAYGRWAVLKHACLLTYPDNYNKKSEQRTRDRNMRRGTRRFLADLLRARRRGAP